MIIVVANDPVLRRDVARLAETLGIGIVQAGRWRELGDRTRWHGLVCVFAARRLDPEATRMIHTIQRESGGLPIILVTPSKPDDVFHLKDIIVDHVVWIEKWRDDLAAALRRAIAEQSVSERLARTIDADPRIREEVIRQAMVGICRADGPLPSVKEFARRACYSESRLAAKLRQALRSRDRVTSRFLAEVRLLKAYDLARHIRAPVQIAAMLGVGVKTLTRAPSRLAKMSFTEFRDLPPGAVLQRAIHALGLTEVAVDAPTGTDGAPRTPTPVPFASDGH